jgi:hypothetical protein
MVECTLTFNWVPFSTLAAEGFAEGNGDFAEGPRGGELGMSVGSLPPVRSRFLIVCLTNMAAKSVGQGRGR